MTDIIKLLSSEAQTAYVETIELELGTIGSNPADPYGEDLEVKIIPTKIAELNATNILLINKEDYLKELKTEQEFKQLNLKNSTTYEKTYKTLKQREEKAKLETNEYNKKIREAEKEVNILKANKHGLELELKLLLKMVG